MEDQTQALLSMPGVGFLGMLIIGILAGWIAEKITASDHGLLTNLLVGIAGSFVGGSLASLMNLQFEGWLGNLLIAAIGAVLVLWLWRAPDGTAGGLANDLRRRRLIWSSFSPVRATSFALEGVHLTLGGPGPQSHGGVSGRGRLARPHMKKPRRRGDTRGFSGSLWGEPMTGRKNPATCVP